MIASALFKASLGNTDVASKTKQGIISIIPATWEVEIRKLEVQGQPRQKVSEIPSQ
jgi:hypothetical protein